MDVALMQNVLAGQHPIVHMSLPDSEPLAPNADLTGKRVALATTFGDYPVTAEVRAAGAATADGLRAAATTVDEVEILLDHAWVADTMFAHFGSSFVTWIDSVVAGRTDQAEPATLQAIELARDASSHIGVLENEERKVRVHLILAELFTKYDALVCPTLAVPAPLADEYYADGITIHRKHLASHLEAALTPVLNIANRDPVLAVPVARSSENVPIGVQVVASPYDDATVFDVGVALEQARGGWYKTEAERPAL